MLVLKKRSEFLAVAKGGRVHKPALTLQYLSGREETHARFGLTVTKKVGNSVVRSRIKRRLRAALNQINVSKSHDFVVIARDLALTLPFSTLTEQLQSAIDAIKK